MPKPIYHNLSPLARHFDDDEVEKMMEFFNNEIFRALGKSLADESGRQGSRKAAELLEAQFKRGE